MRDPLGLRAQRTASDPLGLRGGVRPEEDYSDFRAGLTTFVEGAVGAGDELDALLRRVSGDADSWDEAISASRADMAAFKEDNKNLATALEWGGMAAGFLIPGAAVAKTGQALSKAQQAARLAKVGAAEGAAYGFLAGEGEGRVTSAALGAGLGGGLGYLSGKLLTKNADDIARIDAEEAARQGQGTHIWGDEGFSPDVSAKKGKTGSGTYETSAYKRQVGDVAQEGDGAVVSSSLKDKVGDTVDSILLGTKEWMTKNGNARAARLLTDSELLIKSSSREIDDVFERELADTMRVIDDNRATKTLLINVGRKKAKGEQQRWTMDDVMASARSPEEAAELQKLRDLYDDAVSKEFAGWQKKNKEYFPRKAKGAIPDKSRANIDQYENPVVAFKEYVKDVTAARVLASRFNLSQQQLEKLKPKTFKGGDKQTRLDAVIDLIEKEAVKQGGGKKNAAAVNAANNLAVGLRTALVHATTGGDAIGSIARKATSTGLLANWSNAALNVIEGVSLPIYQSGFKAWAGTVAPGLKATVMRKAAAENPNWLSTHEFGLDRQFMGEVAAEAEKGVGKFVDTMGNFFYKWTGVQNVNEMGQELAANTAIKRGMNLAADGSPKAIEKLRKHPGMRGLDNREFMETVDALKNGDVQNQYVKLFAGNSLADVQPVLASSMPKAFNENPNGRIFYSMLSYMNRQYNRIRVDIGQNLIEAQRRGLNTKEGQSALKDASVASVKYVALMGLANGVWDDMRKAGFNKEDREALFGDGEVRGKEIADMEQFLDYIAETTSNQLMSNISSGAVNIRSEEYGGQPIDITPAPVQAGMRLGSGLLSAINPLSEDTLAERVTPLARVGQSYVPGLSQADKISRTITGERLLTGDPIAEVRDMIEGR